MKYFLIALFTVCSLQALAQKNADRYVSKGDLVARLPIHFSNGFMFVSVPIIDSTDGKVTVINRSFLLDPRASNEGSYLPEDSTIVILGSKLFLAPVSKQRTLKLTLAPSFAKSNFRQTDSTFFGVIGYGFFREYLTVVDFQENCLSLYSIEPEPTLSPKLEKEAIWAPYYDDAVLNYCHCQFPTIWLEPNVAPLNSGRMHLSLADRMSVLYEEALPGKIKKQINEGLYQDSIAGRPNKYAGVEISNFTLGTENIAKLEPHRIIDKLPAVFKDINITVTGTIAIDLIRHFKALIIVPHKSVILLCKY
jgi:hypothetical protein